MFDDPFSPKKGRKDSGLFGGSLDLGWGSSSNKKPKRESIAKSQKNELLARQKNKCAICKKTLDMRATHFDHIKEVYKDGKSTVSNLQALCANCHNIKTHRDKLKQTERKKAQARKRDEPLLGSNLFGSSPRQSKPKEEFDLGIW